MATITIASTVIPNVNYVGTVITWRIFSDKSWVAQDGTIVPARGDSDIFFKEYTIGVVGTNGTVPQITLLSQTDAPNEKNARYSIYWCVDGVLKDMVLANTLGAFQVPDTPASTTWSALELYNFGVQRRYFKDDKTYSALVIDQKIAAVTGTTNLTSSTFAGLPTPATAGKQRLLTDTDEGLVIDTGSSWWSVSNEVCNVKRFGAVGSGLVDDSAAINQAMTVAAARGCDVVFPRGTYAYAIAPNLGITNVTVRSAGTVFLKHTGTGSILVIGDISGSEVRNVRVLGDFHVYGNASSSTEGVLIQGLSGLSKVELTGRGAPSTMFTTKWGVGVEYNLQATSNGGLTWLGPVPVTGVRNTLSASLQAPTNNRYKLKIETVSGTGVVNENVNDCTFTGVSESNLIGVSEDSACARNGYYGFYLDGNFDINKLFTVSAATNASPVEFTTSAPHGFTTGDRVTVVDATLNWLPVNGRWTVTVTSSTKFTIAVDTTAFGALSGTTHATRNIDMDLRGNSTALISPRVASGNGIAIGTDSTTANLTAIAGSVRSVNLNASSVNAMFLGVQFPDSGGLGITGTGTYRTHDVTYINNLGVVTIVSSDVLGHPAALQPTPIAKTVATLLTSGDLFNGLIVGTPPVSGVTVNYQLPTGTNMDMFPGALPLNGSIEWTLMDEAGGAGDTITVTANTGHTIVGNPLIQSRNSAMGTSARLLSRRVSVGVWVTYRVS